MDASEQKLEVIRKLLAKAERAATTDEAEAYNTKAAELMARHGVDAAMVAAADGESRDVIGSRRIAVTDPYSTEKSTLANAIAQAMRCQVVRHPGPRRGQTVAVTVVGFESDLRRVDVTFTSLLLQATRSVVRQRPEWSGESTAAFRRTWWNGFSAEVSRRLSAAERAAASAYDAAVPEGGSRAALVLADRGAVVKQAFAAQFPNLRKGQQRRLSGSGYRAGVEAGRRADVGNARLDTTKRALER